MADSVPRVFLVVVDETPEHQLAVHYAARRAAHTGGRLALLQYHLIVFEFELTFAGLERGSVHDGCLIEI